MKYISLFSGIGGFELGIQRVMGDAECIGFSEIDKFALQVYEHHFPTHENLGDVTKITEEQIKSLLAQHGGCDLVVGGFPCTNLTSLARAYNNCNSDGLDGPSSGLFWDMMNVLRWIKTYNYDRKLHIIVENNASMKNSDKKIITDNLRNILETNIYMNVLNGKAFGVQHRRRIFWTTYELCTSHIEKEQSWIDVLDSVQIVRAYTINRNRINNGNVNKFFDISSDDFVSVYADPDNICSLTCTKNNNKVGKSNFQCNSPSSTEKSHSNPITRNPNRLNNLLADFRIGQSEQFILRYYTTNELERLFWYPAGWIIFSEKTRVYRLLGNSVVVKIIEFIVKEMLIDQILPRKLTTRQRS
ncbi:DNA (cytosine-5-)-methyltransferase [bacterium]|nr:DNA (cytosine-5-)-methyltransferase [bacterium]